MNRKIKFRFWCKGTSDNLNFNKCGWWTYPNFLLDKYFANFDIFESEDFVACQYTGLKDSKGKEIYEGDILKIFWRIESLNVDYYYDLVRWDYKMAWWNPHGPLTIDEIPAEVAGNIFENADLYKDGNIEIQSLGQS